MKPLHLIPPHDLPVVPSAEAISACGRPAELPVVGATVERADAARNRVRILAAAERLFARDGVERTSMEAIAREAGVGKGTLFRRFGDRSSLALTLLGAAETRLQEALIRGPAPLGPGAPPCVRLIAFGRALLRHIEIHGDLLLVAQTAGGPGRRYSSGVYGFYRVHVAMLLASAAPTLDVEYAVDALLAPLSAELVIHQLREREMSVERLADGWEALVLRMLG